MIIRCTSHVITNAFTGSFIIFLKQENRYFPMMLQVLFELMLFMFLLPYSLTVHKATNLTSVAIACAVANGICAIWFFLLAIRADVFEVTYQGALRLSIKRFFPIRPKFLIHIFSTSLPYIVVNSTDMLLLLTCNFVIRSFKVGLSVPA